ncbi:MAG: prepilin-type N-terminal cleavage/methylation domain-containing protein [Phycisphaerae bacterium]
MMNYLFKNNLLRKIKGFSLIETLAALTILAIIGAGSLVVINRAMETTEDSILKKKAFEVARENMEQLLASENISEKNDRGFSEQYPEIEWTTTVEAFYEPINQKMWIQAICSAQYINLKGETITVELTHWLTKLTDLQVKQILAGIKLKKTLLDIESDMEKDIEMPSREEIEILFKDLLKE